MFELNKENDSRLVENGLFEVYKNGDIYRNTKNGKKKCPEFKTSRNGKYRAVSAMQNGKQKHFYVHRLIAQAFIPNPYNKPQINHIDGDSSNNSIENLEWVTAKENVEHAYKTGLSPTLKTADECVSCNNKTMSKDGFCTVCKKKFERLDKKMERDLKIIESLEFIENSVLTKKEKKAIEFRRKAMTYKEIGQLMGVTRQRIDQLINSAFNKTQRFNGDWEDVFESRSSNYTNNKNRLWNIRKSKGVRQHELADYLNITLPTYSTKENRPETFKMSEAIKICEFFDVTLNELFG